MEILFGREEGFGRLPSKACLFAAWARVKSSASAWPLTTLRHVPFAFRVTVNICVRNVFVVTVYSPHE